MVSEKDFNHRAFRAEEKGKEKGEGGPAGPFSREQGSSFPHSQSCGGSFPAEVPAPADPGLTAREVEARTVELPPLVTNPTLQAGGTASEPSATPKDADHLLGEDNSPRASGQVGTIVREPFRPGLGKPLHLLYGTNGGVGPSRPTAGGAVRKRGNGVASVDSAGFRVRSVRVTAAGCTTDENRCGESFLRDSSRRASLHHGESGAGECFTRPGEKNACESCTTDENRCGESFLRDSSRRASLHHGESGAGECFTRPGEKNACERFVVLGAVVESRNGLGSDRVHRARASLAGQAGSCGSLACLSDPEELPKP
ncbi:hypothetical protein KSP39_PZI006996 [Platanthera zijinensis]|uniref:Uncharacterized protein n=1 Tax=Platanthera zijinensis TaxID=2320716 RepID=A0AAP0GAB8_9ASPA